MSFEKNCARINKKLKKKYKLIVIGDPLKDLDDEHAFAALAGLIKKGWVDLLCIVANLSPAQIRARGAKGTMKMLGIDVPVGIGMTVYEGRMGAYETNVPYLADESELEPNGEELMVRLLEEAEDDSIVLELQSGLTDAWSLFWNHTVLFLKKVHEVVIMGGVKVNGEMLALDENGFVVENNANNNSFDLKSAHMLYHTLQQFGVRVAITSREVAYASQVPFSAYDRMMATGNPVADCLKGRQVPALQHLHDAACSPSGSPLRGTLPDDRDVVWFSNVFCGGRDIPTEVGADIWPYVDKFNLYDTANVLAAVREIRELLLISTVIRVWGYKGTSEVEVIGMTPKNHGVKNPAEFAEFMVQMELVGMTS